MRDLARSLSGGLWYNVRMSGDEGLKRADVLTLFHGSEMIVRSPALALGKKNNDYGQGFYCTQDQELACEWACKNRHDGYANRYVLDLTGLSVLNLLDARYSILNWIALLLANRTFSIQDDVASSAREYLLENFLVDLKPYDVVIGYRADDSYFSYAQSFVSNALSLRSLSRAMKLGQLGVQVALVSERAFSNLAFESANPAAKEIYYPKFESRDTGAREVYRTEIRTRRFNPDDVFVMDLMRGRVTRDDVRLQRVVSE